MAVVVIFIILIFLTIVAIHHRLPKAPHQRISALQGVNVKQIYNSEHTKKCFSNHDYKIRAKPDFIYQYSDGSLALVEYKSRRTGGVQSSDIAQLLATAIAVKGEENHPVRDGFILTASGAIQCLDLSCAAEVLAGQIQENITATRKINLSLHVTPTPVKQKCLGCGYRYGCKFAIK